MQGGVLIQTLYRSLNLIVIHGYSCGTLAVMPVRWVWSTTTLSGVTEPLFSANVMCYGTETSMQRKVYVLALNKLSCCR